MLPLRLRAALACIGASLCAIVPRPAAAGNASYIGVAAVTVDGNYYAVFQDTDGVYGSCGLTRVAPKPSYEPPRPFVVGVACLNGYELLPFERWVWARRVPELGLLHAFRRDQAQGAPVRIVRDRDTRVLRVELLLSGRWFPIRADDSGGVTEWPVELRYGSPEMTDTSNWAGISGYVHTGSTSLIRLYRDQRLLSWDEVLVVPDADVPDVAGRFERARRPAAAATARLRTDYAARAGVFIDTPAGPQNRRARKRNRAAAAREVLRQWEQAAAFGVLGARATRDALWLSTWLDVPARRLEAFRWYEGLAERDAPGAAAILSELEQDADTAWLAVHLKGARDPLWKLPDVAGGVLTDAELTPLSDEDLRWLHRAQWAAQGGYRFADAAIQAYFSEFTWYCPQPKGVWARRRSRLKKDPDRSLLQMERAAAPSGASKESLQAILRAERARGMSPPSI
jgi:hypothetical protein